MGFARALWFVGLAVLGLPFLDGLPRLRRTREWLRSALRTRVLLGVLEVGAVLAWFFFLRGVPLVAQDRVWLALPGALIVLLGAVIAGWGRLALGSWFSPNLGIQSGHQLVTTGPYALVRHPIYLGIILFIAGSAPVWNDAGLLLLAGVIGLLLSAHIPIEERMFREHFGERWEAWRARTPALLPLPVHVVGARRRL